MPNFDGTGPLKRGRVIGRGRGSCRECTEDYMQKAENRKSSVQNGTTEE